MYDLPQALIDSLKNIKGFDEKAFRSVHNTPQGITSLRINPDKITTMPPAFQGDKIPWSTYGHYLSERPTFTLDPLLHAGAYYVQEAGSQFLWEVLQQLFPRNEDKSVLDLCAAPGGKTTLLATYFNNGFVVANEVIKSRCAILEENITKWGADNIAITNNDPKDFNRLPGFFDILVVDAPCSGSGLFRKDNQAIEEWSTANVELCSKRQQRIIHDAYATLKNDGYLIYSTCSYSKEENENIVDYILQNFDVENIKLHINNEWNIVETTSDNKAGYGYRFFPHKVRSEGFFIAVFKKKEGTQYTDVAKAKWDVASTKELDEIARWMRDTEGFQFIKNKEKIIAVKEKHLEKITAIKQNVYLKKTGIELGEIKNKGLVPAHNLALSGQVSKNITSINLSKEDALNYLRKKDFLYDKSHSGWVLAAYNELPLGWMKILPNRVNNYYPVEWRILMQ